MKYNLIIRPDTVNKQGHHPIRLRLIKDRKVVYISLKVFVDPEYWSEEQERLIILKGLRKETEKNANEERKKINAFLELSIHRVEDIIYELRKDKRNITLQQFKELFINKPKHSNFKVYIQNHISTLKETNHIGNANTFSTTLRMLEQFDKRLDKKIFSEIDLKYIKNFDNWMQKRGCKGNTRMHYHKKVRAIWNMAIAEKEAPADIYPFGKGGFEVGRLEEETEKRYLPTEYIDKLKTTPSKIKNNEFARNVFLLSYYLYGMSFRDMALLEHRNIVKLNKGKYIVYKRLKTKQTKNAKAISIKLTPEIEKLIATLSSFNKPLGDYLLPLITIEKETEEKKYIHISDRRKTVVGWMKKLSKEFEFDFNLTSYVSRHTMAMQLQDKEIPENVISQILGHKDLRTTKTYLDSLDTSVIDEAASVL